MFCILLDKNTKSYFMRPGEIAFWAYSSVDKYIKLFDNVRLVETEYEDLKELTTVLFNAGFNKGYIDGELYEFTKDSTYFLNRNPNEIFFSQYLLTGSEDYLKLIQRDNLFTLCKIDKDKIFFPTVSYNDETAILAYTDPAKIPQLLFDKYSDWHIVNTTFNISCFVNEKFFLAK